MLASEDRDGPRHAKAAAAGVRVARDMAELAANADVIPSTAAVAVAEVGAAHLQARHLNVDRNSVSPETKKRIGAIVSKTRAAFVEAGS